MNVLRPDLLDDGLDGAFVEKGIICRRKLVVWRRGGLLGGFGAGEPGLDEAGPERATTERTLGDPGEWYHAFIPVRPQPEDIPLLRLIGPNPNPLDLIMPRSMEDYGLEGQSGRLGR